NDRFIFRIYSLIILITSIDVYQIENLISRLVRLIK
ncbi:unnamed protein product, partial [Rotaria sp. Silwood1]